MRFSPATGIFAALVVGAVAIGTHQYKTGQKENKVKARFLTVCEADYESDWCTEQAEQNHGACFQPNYRWQSDGLSNTADVYTFNGNAYNTCLSDGYDTWREAVADTKRVEEAFVQELLN